MDFTETIYFTNTFVHLLLDQCDTGRQICFQLEHMNSQSTYRACSAPAGAGGERISTPQTGVG